MKFFRVSLLSLILLLPSVTRAQQQPTAELQQTSARLAGEVLVNGRAWEYAQNLSDKFGGRLSKSHAYALADRPERIAPQFKHDDAGEMLKKANLEEFLKTVGVWK